MSQHLGLTETEAFNRAINLAREEDVPVWWAGAIARSPTTERITLVTSHFHVFSHGMVG